MKDDTPARLAMAYYFVHDHEGRRGTTIASRLSSELKVVTTVTGVLSSQLDLDLPSEVAQHRDRWKDLLANISCEHYELWYDKELKRADARKAAKLNTVENN